jgi:hypothetical protein
MSSQMMDPLASQVANRSASGKSFADFQKKAEELFWSEVAAQVNSKQKYAEAKVKWGLSVVFLTFEGVDASDMALDGYASLITLENHNVKLVVTKDSAYTGHGEVERVFKTGVLTTSLAADIIQEFIDVRR